MRADIFRAAILYALLGPAVPHEEHWKMQAVANVFSVFHEARIYRRN
jgi:hypothetical protein